MFSAVIEFCDWRWSMAAMLMLLSGPALGEVRGVSPELSAMLARCAPSVHPETMAAIVSAESRGHRYAIADAGPKHLPWAKRKALVRSFYESSLDSAVARVNGLLAQGHTVSMGPAQLNDRNLPALGMTVRDAFDSCKNVAGGGEILTAFYVKAAKQYGPGSRALRAALSAYNSGSFVRGEKDGYVDLVFKQRGRPLELKSGGRVAVSASSMRRVNKDGRRGFAMAASGFTAGVE